MIDTRACAPMQQVLPVAAVAVAARLLAPPILAPATAALVAGRLKLLWLL